MTKKVVLPLTDETLQDLKAGDNVLLTGVMYVARDAAHKRIVEALDGGKPLPFDIKGQTIYFMGPSPAKPGQPIGSAGPTTSGRMDSYSPRLIAEGLKGMIGKGMRSQAVKDAMKQHKAVYLAAIGGAGALIPKSIKNVRIVDIKDFDRMPDGGCHVSSLKEIGTIRVKKLDNKGKNNRRLYFTIE